MSDRPTYLEIATKSLAGDYAGPNRITLAALVAWHVLKRQGIDPTAPVELPDMRQWFTPPLPVLASDIGARCAAAVERRRAIADVLAAAEAHGAKAIAMHPNLLAYLKGDAPQ